MVPVSELAWSASWRRALVLTLQAIVVSSACFHPLAVRADTNLDITAKAKAHFDKALMLAAHDRFADAAAEFEKSMALVSRPTTQFNLAVMLFRLERFAPSLHMLDDFLSRTDPIRDVEQRNRASALRERALERVATVVIKVTPANAKASGIKAVGLGTVRTAYLVPGRHEVVFAAPGYVSRTIAIEARAAQTQAIQVALATEPQPRPKLDFRSRTEPSRAVPWTLVVGGGVMLASAGVTGVLALEADREVTSGCPSDGSVCTEVALRPAQSRAMTLAAVTDVLAVTGVLSLGVGLVWLALGSDGAEQREPPVALSVSRLESDGVLSNLRIAF